MAEDDCLAEVLLQQHWLNTGHLPSRVSPSMTIPAYATTVNIHSLTHRYWQTHASQKAEGYVPWIEEMWTCLHCPRYGLSCGARE